MALSFFASRYFNSIKAFIRGSFSLYLTRRFLPDFSNIYPLSDEQNFER